MNRYILIFFSLTFVLSLQAQETSDPPKIQAALQDYITANVPMTQSESEVFFPLYNRMQDKKREIRNRMRQLNRDSVVDEAQLRTIILQRDDLGIQLKQVEKEYHERFLEIIPARKLMDIMSAESKFLRQTLRRIAKKSK